MSLTNVSVSDWAGLAVGLTGALLGYAQSRDRLPSWARRWMNRLGKDEIERAIDYAARMSGLSPAERRSEAVAYLVRLSQKELGFPVPESIANLLVEFVFQQWKRKG